MAGFPITVKNLVGGRTYYFRVLANSVKSYESSEEVKYPVPARVKHKAITAGVVGGILFFIVAIILSVCAVKICNKRKRRKQEKGNYEYILTVCLFKVEWNYILEFDMTVHTDLELMSFPPLYPIQTANWGFCNVMLHCC